MVYNLTTQLYISAINSSCVPFR